MAEENYWANESLPEEDMTTREMNILLLLAIEAFSKDSEAEISFQGIKTKLNLHQQKLTISLKRLQKKKMIEKTLNGYKISKKGMELIDHVLKSPKTASSQPKHAF